MKTTQIPTFPRQNIGSESQPVAQDSIEQTIETKAEKQETLIFEFQKTSERDPISAIKDTKLYKWCARSDFSSWFVVSTIILTDLFMFFLWKFRQGF